jgi:micrococcal nuclease
MSRKRKLVAGAVGAFLFASAGFWTINNSLRVPAYRMAQVIDGDSFTTTEKQSIRLASNQAPESGLCYSTESAQLLHKLLFNKKIYLKVIYTDPFHRLVSLVYTEDGLVNKMMIEKGASYFADGYNYDDFITAQNRARVKKLGIFSERCLPSVNTAHPDCVIKGNINIPHPKLPPTYSFPGCSQYSRTLVQLSLGDQWFCTEKEAQKAGFAKATDCYNKTWK